MFPFFEIQNLDDEAMLRDIDFSQFEAQFQLPAKLEGQQSRQKRARVMNKYASQIHFVEVNRAKNMSKLLQNMKSFCRGELTAQNSLLANNIGASTAMSSKCTT